MEFYYQWDFVTAFRILEEVREIGERERSKRVIGVATRPSLPYHIEKQIPPTVSGGIYSEFIFHVTSL